MSVQDSDFFQSGPKLTNTFSAHRWLGAYLKWKLPANLWPKIHDDLNRLGAACAGEYESLARQAERERPEHIPFDAWGRRMDEIRVSPAWRELQSISAREGLVAIGYERAEREFSRLYQFAKLYLFHPSSAFFTCPLAMGDGAAKVLELFGRESIHRDVFRHLTTRNPEEFWTSGQWMTEKTGGSDVSGTRTIAKKSGDEIRLFGVKWFSSSTKSEVALALARYEDAPQGSKGLSLFLLPTYLQSGELNGIEVLRLKEKLGTTALPTAELKLNGALAYPIGDRDHGVKTVATMLNITRLYNSICSVGQMTRGLDLLRDYSRQRLAFGGPLTEHTLHYVTFAAEEAKLLAGFLLTMEMVNLLGREEAGVASSGEQDLLRLFTPITKLFTAKMSVQTASEVVEGFGGAGYVEDTGIPLQLRDSQVFAIWEGATNVLSLDLVRVVSKSNALSALQSDIKARLKALRSPSIAESGKRFGTHWSALEKDLSTWAASASDMQQASARDLAFQLAWTYAYVLLLSWADHEAGANQKLLLAFLNEMEPCLQAFVLRTPEKCQNSYEAYSRSLEI